MIYLFYEQEELNMPTKEQTINLENKKALICQMYIDGYSSNEISFFTNVSKSGVLSTLKKNNIVIRDLSTSHKIYKCNESIFEKIDSHEKAYWIGFLQADATITSGRLVLSLATKDHEHLIKFKEFIDSNHKIHKYKSNSCGKNSIIKNKNKSYFYSYLGISSSKMIQDLKKYSIFKRKTFTTKFGKNIPKQYINSYMAGLLDADGFVTVSNNKITLGFLGNNDTGPKFQATLNKNIKNLSNNKIILHPNNKNVSIRFSGAQILDIGSFLYKNTNIFLERKRNKILNFFCKDSF